MVLCSEYAFAESDSHSSTPRRTLLWDMGRLSQTPRAESADAVIKKAENVIWKEGIPPLSPPVNVKPIWLTGEKFNGKPTKIFAWVGVPKTSRGRKVPGMVLVHGGGGTAFGEWVAMWNRRGYAAIAIDTSGHIPCSSKYGRWPAHEYSGPQACDDFTLVDRPVKDQWTYHAVSAIIIAHSYLRSLPQVDAKRTGITGISWGGYLTCITASVDSRFKVAIPIYGCGFLGDDSMWAGNLNALGEARRRKWLELWDPSEYVRNMKMPVLWVAYRNDTAYPLDSLMRTCDLLPNKCRLCLPEIFGHSHEYGWSRPEIFEFADSILIPGRVKSALPVIIAQGSRGKTAWIKIESAKPVKSAKLFYTKDSCAWPKRKWQVKDIAKITRLDKVETQIPAGTVAYYFNVIYDQDKCVSSSVQETATSPKNHSNPR